MSGFLACDNARNRKPGEIRSDPSEPASEHILIQDPAPILVTPQELRVEPRFARCLGRSDTQQAPKGEEGPVVHTG